MQITFPRVALLAAAALLLGLAALPSGQQRSYAAPLADLTETAEPSTRTPTTGPSTTPTEGPSPTPTEGPSPTPTEGPSPTPTEGPSPTPTEGLLPTPTRRPPRPAPPPPTEAPAQPVLTKEITSGEARVGEVLEFTIRVTNPDPVPAKDVVVTDPLPAFLQLLDASASRGNVSVDGNTVTVRIESLEPGETVTIRVTARILSQPLPPDDENVAVLTNGKECCVPGGRTRVRIPFPTPVAETPTAAPAPAGQSAPPPRRLPSTGGAGEVAFLITALGALGLGFMARRRR